MAEGGGLVGSLNWQSGSDGGNRNKTEPVRLFVTVGEGKSVPFS